MFRRNCGCNKKCGCSLGSLLIAAGAGILIAYIIPYYLLIILLGIAFVTAGIWLVGKY